MSSDPGRFWTTSLKVEEAKDEHGRAGSSSFEIGGGTDLWVLSSEDDDDDDDDIHLRF